MRLKFYKEDLDLRTAKLAVAKLLPLGIDAVGVKNVLSDTQADCNRLHHLIFSSVGRGPYRGQAE